MYKHFFKRIFDIIVGLCALPFVLLLIIIVGPIIYFTDRGPIFYNGPRIGLNGKVFKMCKFRSMRVNAPDLRTADGSTYNGDDDPRVTKVGRFLRKTSLDEIPQFLNVLAGQMSFVGNRPDTPRMLDVYTEEQKKWLLITKPGITGYSQAYYRNSTTCEEKIANDIYYAKNESFMFDLKIVFRTVRTVLFRENINRSDV
ncbi:MAG: sugar transferase [Bacteroidales bacterium]|nr:sugar transferase [Bacteroidales bacterium]